MASAAGARAEVSAVNVSVDASDVTRATVYVTLRNVGLAPFTQPLSVCARVATHTAHVDDAAGWAMKDGALCGTAPPLASRADKQLAAVPLTIRGSLASNRYVEIEVTARHPSAAGEMSARYVRDAREMRARCACAQVCPSRAKDNNNTATTTAQPQQQVCPSRATATTYASRPTGRRSPNAMTSACAGTVDLPSCNLSQYHL